MSTAPKVSASAAAGGVPASGWTTPAGRYGLNAPIDPVSMTGFFDIPDSWQQFMGDGSRRQGNFGYSTKREAPYFTPLVGRMAAAFPANEVVSEGRSLSIPFLADLRRAVATYEYSMRVTGDSPAMQGGLVNRYY